MPSAAKVKLSKKELLVAFCLTTLVYLIFSYGAIRSPDSEIMFRTSLALADSGHFYASEQLQWKEFGLPKGKDGNRYSIFGPAQAIAAVPLIKLSQIINKSKWYQSYLNIVPTSHYVPGGIMSFLRGETATPAKEHALRFWVCLFYVFVSSASVIVFLKIMIFFTASRLILYLIGNMFAFGTLVFAYALTFFSEPLALLFVLLSFLQLLRYSTAFKPNRTLLAAGLFLGLAVATHISAILFAPFFLVIPLIKQEKELQRYEWIKKLFLFSSLFLLVIACIGLYNYLRFGSFLETGRTADPHLRYAFFTLPFEGLLGLLLSPGKGVIWFCPAVILGLAFWRSFHDQYKSLSILILFMIAFRIIFISCRTDWHGGFCLGPRYLVMAIPFFLIPLGPAFEKMKRKKAEIILFLVTSVCVLQELYFNTGEVFSFLHFQKFKYSQMGINVFENNLLYFNLHLSPVLHILEGKTGPFLMQNTELTNLNIWLFGSAVFLTLFAGLFIILKYKYKDNLNKKT
ncbi:MAG: hypothetical protein U5R06_04500 [candidate division KSB1 bacterium]|nr:hypothetical protein [candidate division KSB1 bacterium]